VNKNFGSGVKETLELDLPGGTQWSDGYKTDKTDKTDYGRVFEIARVIG